jgi:hypothetical protein
MSVVVFWGAVAGMLGGSVVLERRRRKKLQREAEQGTLRSRAAEGSSPEAIDSPIAAEGLMRGGMRPPFR